MMIERTIEPIFRTVCIFYNLKGTDTIYILRVRDTDSILPLYNVIESKKGKYTDLYDGDNEKELESILTEKLGMKPF